MAYMSQNGYDNLVAEIRRLESVERPKASAAIAEAADKGDLSENYEYRAARREQSRVLGRIRFLQRVLSQARVLPASAADADYVQLLSRVELLNLDTRQKMAYTIVSPHEANAREGKISVKSPMASALMKKRKGDVVTVRVPIGVLRIRIEGISR